MSDKRDMNDLSAARGPKEAGDVLAQLTEAAPDMATVLRNYTTVQDESARNTKGQPLEKRKAIGVDEIRCALLSKTECWPKRVGQRLFVVQAGAVRYLPNQEDLFAWMSELGPLSWGHGLDGFDNNLLSRPEFFSHLCNLQQPSLTGEEMMLGIIHTYCAVETLPHEPPLPEHFYTWKPPVDYAPAGQYLSGLCSYFDNLEHDVDRLFLVAFFVTPAWGGLYGSRPAFALEAPDRGCGKTTLANALGWLYGGSIDTNLTKQDDEKLPGRLLSIGALSKRIVLADNIKKGVSSGTLEALITAHKISGHLLYHGEASRPNTLTWVLTANGLRMSRDMAERCFIIRLKKPNYRPDWREEVSAYIGTNRDKILADILALLRNEPIKTDAKDRWNEFVSKVLARCTDNADAVERAVTVNQSRRDDHDEDMEEAGTLQDAIDAALPTDLTIETHFIAAARMTDVVNEALNLKFSARKVAYLLKGHIEAGRLMRVQKSRTSDSKGWEVTRPPTKKSETPLTTPV